MSIQKSQLCRPHHDDQQAPRLLKEYLDSYTSPFPDNKRYISQIASEGINIRGSDLTRLRAFGTFLQTYELPEVLTWDAIDRALPASGQYIRSCLFQLGDVLAERGKMQGWESHLSNGGLRRSLQRTPVAFVQPITDFQQWRLEGSVNPNLQLSLWKTQRLSNAPRTIVEHTNMVVRFLSFCAGRNIGSLLEIGPAVITQYQQTILWQLECRKCRNRIPLTSPKPTEQCVNPGCGAIESYARTRRLARGTLISHMSALRLFFDWAKLQNLVVENPFLTICCGGARTFTVRDDQGEMFEVAEAIRRYDDAVVEKLCAYIVSPSAEPEEAIVLYLIIFHFLTNGELRNLRIPSLVNAGFQLPDGSRPVEDFEHLHLPLRPLTRGNRSVVRTEMKIVFHPKALSWLTPILQRFYEKRALLVRAQHKQHFLVVEKSAFCNKPVTKDYVAHVVRTASIRALGEAVSPSNLRRTAADILSLRSKRRGAILTTMGFSSLSATRFNYLERFPLQPKKARSLKDIR
jgi:site-specific recombinase XerD